MRVSEAHSAHVEANAAKQKRHTNTISSLFFSFAGRVSWRRDRGTATKYAPTQHTHTHTHTRETLVYFMTAQRKAKKHIAKLQIGALNSPLPPPPQTHVAKRVNHFCTTFAIDSISCVFSGAFHGSIQQTHHKNAYEKSLPQRVTSHTVWLERLFYTPWEEPKIAASASSAAMVGQEYFTRFCSPASMLHQLAGGEDVFLDVLFSVYHVPE